MRRLALLVLAAFSLVGCSSHPSYGPEGVGYWHDDAHAVGCWTFGNGGGSYSAGISCLPDKDYQR